jgi:ribose transport system substrate-binding protein
VRARPDAIVGGGVPGAVVGKQLAEAKKAGIPTLNIDDSGAGGPGWDHYIPGGFNLQNEVLAAAIVADSGGKANVVWVNGGAVYNQVELALVEEYLKRCTGCAVKDDKADPAAAVDPVKAGQYMASLLRKEPDVDYVVWPFAEPVYGAALQAVRSSGSKVKLVTIQGTPTALEAVRAGEAPFVTSYPLTPTILAGFDALNRIFAGQPVPESAEWTAATTIWRKGDASLPQAGGIGAIETSIAQASDHDFLDTYGKAWGVDIQDAFAGVK